MTRRSIPPLLVLLMACASRANAPSAPSTPPPVAREATPARRAFEVHGHRGTRALRPENTIPSFVAAIELGADTLELDLLLTKDGVVVVHHDSALHPQLTRDASGAWLTETGPAIASLTFAELSTYDVGRARPGAAHAAAFPRQQGMDGVRVPSLRDVVVAAERASGGRIRYNMELKTSPGKDSIAEALVAATLALVRAEKIAERTMIQSFDLGAVALVQAAAPELRTGCLTDESRLWRGAPRPSRWTAPHHIDEFGGSIPRLVRAAGCTDWTPNHATLTEPEVREAHDLGLRVIPWTVNDLAQIRKLGSWGVDGIITDDPSLVRR